MNRHLNNEQQEYKTDHTGRGRVNEESKEGKYS
jgi:hypothetical protein